MTEPTTAPQPAAVSRNPWRSGSRRRVVLGFIAAVGVPFVWIVANWGSAWYAFFFVFFFWRRGFLDGWRGLLLAYLAAHYVRLKYAKLWVTTRQ